MGVAEIFCVTSSFVSFSNHRSNRPYLKRHASCWAGLITGPVTMAQLRLTPHYIVFSEATLCKLLSVSAVKSVTLINSVSWCFPFLNIIFVSNCFHNQSSYPSINVSINQPINQSVNQLSNPICCQSINQSIISFINESINQFIHQSMNQSICQSINQSINHSINSFIIQSIVQYTSQSIFQSIN